MEQQEPSPALLIEIKSLHDTIRAQQSYSHTIILGILYGIGFVIGSTVIATILLGYFVPYFSSVPWVHDNFVRGESVMYRR